MIGIDVVSVIGLVLVVVVLGLAAGATTLAVSARRDRTHRLTLVPGVAPRVPVSWAGSHDPEARAHRRLVDATRSLRTTGVPPPQRERLETEALRIEAALVAAAATPGSGRGAAVTSAVALVERFETAVAEVVAGSLGRPETFDAVVGDVAAALRAIEEARAEVERIDRDGTAG